MTVTNTCSIAWITWESQPRNHSMARELGASLRVVPDRGPRFVRYLRSAWSTMRFLFETRPAVVCAPNPSIVLTYWLLLLRSLLRFRFVSDAHYGGVVAVTGNRVLQRLLDLANRHADLVIVTNQGHARLVERVGGRPVVCPDPLPQLPVGAAAPTRQLPGGKTVLFICSFDLDEPYEAVFAAAPALAAEGFRLLVSGNYSKAGLQSDSVPHATLLGYVERQRYYECLLNADVLLDLTTFQDCLVCGAYEAMAAAKPCVLSDTSALREHFTHGVVFTTHEPAQIAGAVIRAYEEREILKREIATWRRLDEARMSLRIAELRRALDETRAS